MSYAGGINSLQQTISPISPSEAKPRSAWRRQSSSVAFGSIADATRSAAAAASGRLKPIETSAFLSSSRRAARENRDPSGGASDCSCGRSKTTRSGAVPLTRSVPSWCRLWHPPHYADYPVMPRRGGPLIEDALGLRGIIRARSGRPAGCRRVDSDLGPYVAARSWRAPALSS